ncbi:hypothetical protein EJB05_53711, partial [Eragrostis curvula]
MTVTRPLSTTAHDIPDRLLHSIIVNHLRCHVSVIRAAAVCNRWRRIASTRGMSYPEWYRHDFSTCIGHYHAADPSFSPSRAQRHAFVPVSRTINARHFSLDFLPIGPGGRPWELVNGCGSLLLLAVQRRGFFPDLVVCEPVSQRYVRIHPIPEMKYFRCLGAFLDYRYNVIAMSSFTVTCVLSDHAAGMDEGVSVVTSRVYNHCAPPNPPTRLQNGWNTWQAVARRGIHLRGAQSAHFAGCAWGSVFFGVEDDGTVFSVEKSSSKFSHFCLPEHVRGSHHRSTFRFVEGARVYPNPVMARVVSVFGDELRVFVKRKNNNDGSINWTHENTLRLPEATRGLPGHKECYFSRTAKIITSSKDYVVLTPVEETWLFSVELRTMQVEREHIRNRVASEVYPYELEMRPKCYPRGCCDRCYRLYYLMPLRTRDSWAQGERTNNLKVTEADEL